MNGFDLPRCRLYGILDLGYVEAANLEQMARHMIAGGVDLIQLRAKKLALGEVAKLAADLHKITQAAGVPLIINDHSEIVRDGIGQGVHLGQNDLPIVDARELVGRKILVGKSTHSSEQAVAAESEGADYVGFGPLFATPTKPDYPPIGLDRVKTVHEAVRVPVFCIGGIKLDNLAQVLAAGARRVVIVSELLQNENVEAYAKAAKSLLLASVRQSEI